MSEEPGAGDRASHVRTLARFLDDAVRIPGTSVRLGFDALVGLVPGVGDVAGAALSGYVVVAAARLGTPPSVLLVMVFNVAVDTVIGSVPALGDLFDIGWKANVRNAALLDRHLAAPGPTRVASRWTIAAVVGSLLLLAAGAVALSVVVVRGLLALAR